MSKVICPITKLVVSLLSASAGKLRNAKAEKSRAEKLAPLCDGPGASIIAGLLKSAPDADAKSAAKALAGQWAAMPIGGMVPKADGSIVAVADYVADLRDKARAELYKASYQQQVHDAAKAGGFAPEEEDVDKLAKRIATLKARVDKFTVRLDLESAVTAQAVAA